MSTSIPVKESDLTAPTPQNTPLQAAPITQGLSRPTVPDIAEDDAEGEEATAPGAAALQDAAFGIMQGRLASLIGRSSGYVENLPVEQKRTIEALKGVQSKYNDLQNQYKRECWELEKKYLDLQKPIYERRHAILSGSVAPTAEEIAAGEKISAEDDEDEEHEPLPPVEGAIPATAVPQFWLTALRNHVQLSEIITEEDAEVLKHLIDVRVSYLPNDDPGLGYRLAFVFSSNEWFENETLEKTYVYRPEVGYHGEFLYERAIGTDIKWKSEEKDLTKTIEVKKQRNKNTNRTRLVKKTRPRDSFFNFFSPPAPPTDDDQDNMDDEELEELEMKLEVDYQIGEDFKEKIIPRAVDYFTGKALEYDSMDEDEFDEDDDEDFDDDDEDDDQDSDDSDAPPRRRGGKNRGGDQVDPQDCKQQ